MFKGIWDKGPKGKVTVAVKTVRTTRVTQATVRAFMKEITVSCALRFCKRNSFHCAPRLFVLNVCSRAARLPRPSQVMAPLHHPNLVILEGACWNDGPDKLAILLGM